MCLGTTGVVTSVHDDDGVPMALVVAGDGQVIPACLLTCPQALAGDTVLIHSGYVLQVFDPQEGAHRENPGRPGAHP
jgi:hydrogenase maturation factor